MIGPPLDARRVTVAPERLARWLDGFADRHGALTVDAEPDRVLVTGAGDGSRAWIDVPFPPLERSDGRPLTTLQVHVAQARRIGVLLVRRAGFAVGIFSGERLLASKVDSTYVQGTTKAGGWSQQRYARRRANQAAHAFAEAADVTVRILLPELATLDAVFTGGDRPAVASVLDDPRLSGLRPLVAATFLAVGDPKRAVLEATPTQFRAVHIAVHP